jgi:Iap family predicted aminopeptidase
MVAAALTRRRAVRVASRAALALAAALTLESVRAPTVPGANDNATGVAGVLELVRRLRHDRPSSTEVIVLICGCEESGMGGMAAWLAGAGGTLDARRTLVVGLDTIGSGAPVVLGAEGGLWPVRYRGADLALADRAASRSGVALKRWRIGGWTDPVLARLRGLPSLSILSVKDGGFPNYHLPSDVPEHVDWPCVAQCVDLAEAAVAEIGVWFPRFG